VIDPPLGVPRSRHASRFADFPGVLFDHRIALSQRGKWNAHFHSRVGVSFAGQIVLEVGCFDAGFLSEIAIAHPSVGFVGIDWKFKPLIDAAERVVATGPTNLALIRGRAQDLIAMFAPDEIDQIWVFHPEPCDEPKQRPNRLLSPAFLDQARLLLSQNGKLIIKTDHAEYATSTLALLRGELTSHWTLEFTSNDFWNDAGALERADAQYFGRRRTFYETRYLKRREAICYIEITRGGS
jgi:tRNA G46 methylase TrmB